MDTGNWKWNLETWNLKQEHETINFISLLSLVNCENNLYRIVSMITAWPRAKGDPSDERSDMEVDWSQRPKFAHTILTSYILILILIKLCSAQPCISLVLKDLHLNLRCANFPRDLRGAMQRFNSLNQSPVSLSIYFWVFVGQSFWNFDQVASYRLDSWQGFRFLEHVDPVEGPPEGQPSRLLTLWRPSHRVHHIKYRFCSFTIAFRTQNKWALPRGRHIVFVPVQLPSEPRTRGDDGDLGLLVNTAWSKIKNQDLSSLIQSVE